MSEPQQDFVDFECPYCRREVAFPAESAGSVQECLWCSRDILVPQRRGGVTHGVRLDVRTPRLFFRRLNGSDREDLLEIVPDGDVLRFLDWRSLDAEEVDKWLAEDKRVGLVDPGFKSYFGVELQNGCKLIALVQFDYYSEEFRHARFDIVVNRAFYRQGYGTEIIHGIHDFAFREMNLHRVTAICDSRNVAGLRMLERSRMRREGEFVENRKIREEWVSTIHFGMLQREWQSNPQ